MGRRATTFQKVRRASAKALSCGAMFRVGVGENPRGECTTWSLQPGFHRNNIRLGVRGEVCVFTYASGQPQGERADCDRVESAGLSGRWRREPENRLRTLSWRLTK